jgi:hypothetical protein
MYGEPGWDDMHAHIATYLRGRRRGAGHSARRGLRRRAQQTRAQEEGNSEEKTTVHWQVPSGHNTSLKVSLERTTRRDLFIVGWRNVTRLLQKGNRVPQAARCSCMMMKMGQLPLFALKNNSEPKVPNRF